MTVCGIKLTHDSGVALIQDGRLVFSVEAVASKAPRALLIPDASYLALSSVAKRIQKQG